MAVVAVGPGRSLQVGGGNASFTSALISSMMPLGVSGGATIPYQATSTAKPFAINA